MNMPTIIVLILVAAALAAAVIHMAKDKNNCGSCSMCSNYKSCSRYRQKNKK